jgi:hypothetical protein
MWRGTGSGRLCSGESAPRGFARTAGPRRSTVASLTEGAMGSGRRGERGRRLDAVDRRERAVRGSRPDERRRRRASRCLQVRTRRRPARALAASERPASARSAHNPRRPATDATSDRPTQAETKACLMTPGCRPGPGRFGARGDRLCEDRARRRGARRRHQGRAHPRLRPVCDRRILTGRRSEGAVTALDPTLMEDVRCHSTAA